jgi:hypothetical protein
VLNQRLSLKGLHYEDWDWARAAAAILGAAARQGEVELVDQELQFGLGLGVAGQHDLAAVDRGQMDVDHLDGGELF